jgi:L-gulonolactone oxidase
VTEFAFDLGEVENFLVALRDELRKPEYLVHAPVEIRFGPPETSWLSPAYGRTTCWVGWVRYRPFNLEAPEDGLFSKLRELARSFGAIPCIVSSNWSEPNTTLRVSSPISRIR